MEDWADLHDEALEVLDSVGLKPKGFTDKVKTNFRNSMNVSGLHSDSKSGTLHLHIDCCRVDIDGKTNDAHDIHERAMKAAEIINMRRGWKQPQTIRDMRKEELADFCYYTLSKMQEFDIQKYFRLLRMKGYEVNPKYDKHNKLVGYTVGKNAYVFKASEIGRRYMVSTIEATWRKLHPQPTLVKIKPSFPLVTPATRSARPMVQTPVTTKPIAQPKPTNTVFSINTAQGIKEVTIPDTIKDIFINDV